MKLSAMILAFILGVVTTVQAQTASTLPADSVYQLTSKWTSQKQKPFAFRDLEGHPVMMTMIFTTCTSVCPLMVGDIRSFDAKLTEDEKKNVRYLLVSLDSKNDTPERLAKFAEKMRLDERWILVSGSEGDVRETAAVLGFQYRKLGDGAYTHASTFYLLDRGGRIAAKKDRGTPYEPLVQTFRSLQKQSNR